MLVKASEKEEEGKRMVEYRDKGRNREKEKGMEENITKKCPKGGNREKERGVWESKRRREKDHKRQRRKMRNLVGN